MSAIPALCESPCETCAKQGLPLLLTRYALMPNEAGAPRLAGDLDAPDLKKVPVGTSAHYGLRLLRSGFVYVYDEKRTHWDEYFVTTDGFMSKMPPRIRALKEQPRPATEFRCARNGSAPLAGVITIRNAKHAGKVWIAFSDAEWTDAVFQAHMDARYRQNHMKCVIVSAGKVATQSDTAPLAQVEQIVTEFKLAKTKAESFFAKWCPHAYNSRQGMTLALLQAAEAVRPGGGAAIVALHDPVGLTMEIASLMEVRKRAFMNHEGVAHPRFAASTVASLESAIKEQAKLERIADAKQLSAQMIVHGGAANLLPSYQRQVQQLAVVSAQEIREAAEVKWRTYTHDRTGKPRFDAKASTDWLSSYNDGLKAFDAEQIAPLAQAHVAWTTHRCMISHLSCNYDRADLDSGAAFTAAVARMFRHTSDKQPCYDLYLGWLKEGETQAASNILMRALAFNQDKLLAEIGKADAAPVDGRAFPSDMLVDYVKDGLLKLPAAGHAAMADLLQSVGGVLFRNLEDALKGGAPARALAAVAAVAGVQYTTVEVKGHRGKFVQHMMQSIMQLDPNLKVSHNEMGKAVAAQLRLMEIEGLPINESDKRRWLVVLDRRVAGQAAGSGLTGSQLAEKLAGSIKSADDLPSLKAEAFRAGVAGKAFDAGGNFVIGLVQSFNFVKLVNDYTQGMQHEKNEALARMVTASVAIVGSFGEATGLALQRMQEVRLRNAPGLSAARLPDVLKFGGKALGLAAGLIIAVLDLKKWRTEREKGDKGLSGAYFATGLLGGSLAIAFFFSHLLGPIGWLLVGVAVIVLFVVTAWIELNKDNKVQEWLMRCHFGTRADKYKSYSEESEQLKLAFA